MKTLTIGNKEFEIEDEVSELIIEISKERDSLIADATDTKEAFNVIKKAMIDDKPSEQGSYAHSWHCNIAMMCYDAMAEAASKTDELFCHDDAHKTANDAASRFMKLCFGVETKA